MSGISLMILLIVCLVVVMLCAGIIHGMFTLNKYQLKRKAQFGDKNATLVFALHAVRYQLMAVLVVFNIIATTIVVVLLESSMSNALLAIVASTALILVFGELIPIIYIKKHVLSIAGGLYPILHHLMLWTSPVTRPLGRVFEQWAGNDTQIFYTKEELMKIFDGQKLSENSDVAADEARMIHKVLAFGEKKIRDVMTPRRMAKIVSRDDVLSPTLLNDLHSSGHSRFPVVMASGGFDFVGTLYIRDVTLTKKATSVAEIMSRDILYAHEEKSLDFALRTFLKTKHHMLVIVNNFEEFVGILSLEDVLEEIIGKEIVDEFDAHDDLRAVAASLAEAEAKKHHRSTKKPTTS